MQHPFVLIIAVSLVLGLAGGFVMHRSDFCVTAMFRDFFLFRAMAYAELHPWWSALARATTVMPGKVTLPRWLGVEPYVLLTPMGAVGGLAAVSLVPAGPLAADRHGGGLSAALEGGPDHRRAGGRVLCDESPRPS